MIWPPRAQERVARLLLWLCTGLAVAVLIFIVTFVFYHGVPQLHPFFLLQQPARMGKEGGILPFVVATLYMTAIAVLVAAPLGIGTAMYLSEYTREGKLTAVIRFGADCLAGVPSIIFGLFGFVFFVIRLRLGWSMLSGGLTLALMVLPTIIRTSEEAIRAVPAAYRDVAFGLGSTRWQMVARVVLPVATPGILTGIVLSIGRSISETAAVMLTAGSSLKTPISPMHPGRNLAYHFYILVMEGISQPNAYKTATVLVLSIVIINFLTYWLMRRFIARLSGG